MAAFSQTFEENALRRRIFDFLAKFLRSSFLTVGALRTLPRRTFSPPFAASLPRISGSRPVFAFAAANCRIKIETVSESGDSAPGADPSLFFSFGICCKYACGSVLPPPTATVSAKGCPSCARRRGKSRKTAQNAAKRPAARRKAAKRGHTKGRPRKRAYERPPADAGGPCRFLMRSFSRGPGRRRRADTYRKSARAGPSGRARAAFEWRCPSPHPCRIQSRP